jgi:hypothetical protein
MKIKTVLLVVILSGIALSGFTQEKVRFGDYFTSKTLRIDYFHSGDSKTDLFSPDRIYVQGDWAGNPDHCIQPFELGSYKAKIIDIASNWVIYTKGYSTIFSEYQTTAPALQGISKTFHESVLIPLPLRPFIFIIEKRDKYNILQPIYRVTLDPSDYHVNNETKKDPDDKIIPVVKSGDPGHCVDLVILGEGYRLSELEKFKSDLNYYTSLFFTVEPYKSRKNLFNVTGILSPSVESGTDEPRQGIYRNTKLGSSFNALDLDRYCLADDNKTIRDVASQVPYDAILIMVNLDRYGGGGIYNWQTVFNTGSQWKDYVFLHEFGHAFAGLGDEYFNSEVAYQDFYTTGVEPLEANVTALLDTANVKWKQFLSPGIKVPTEWGKARFDSLNQQISLLNEERARVLSQMKQTKASPDVISGKDKEYQDKVRKVNKELDDFINNHPLKDKVGVFEGANYMSKGLYRPTVMSLMHKFSENDRSYGVVNEHAITETIDYYTGR